MRKLPTLLASAALVAGGMVAATPAEAASYGSSKICIKSTSWTYIKAKDINTGATNSLTPWPGPDGGSLGECTGYHYGPYWRVDTDPQGSAHSYRTRYDVLIGGDWNVGNWNDCHTNSDNHSSDPADPNSGATWRIVYTNYDHGDCTN